MLKIFESFEGKGKYNSFINFWSRLFDVNILE